MRMYRYFLKIRGDQRKSAGIKGRPRGSKEHSGLWVRGGGPGGTGAIKIYVHAPGIKHNIRKIAVCYNIYRIIVVNDNYRSK